MFSPPTGSLTFAQYQVYAIRNYVQNRLLPFEHPRERVRFLMYCHHHLPVNCPSEVVENIPDAVFGNPVVAYYLKCNSCDVEAMLAYG